MKMPALSIRSILLYALGVLTVLVGSFAAHSSFVDWQEMEKVQSLNVAASLGDQLFDTAAKLSTEREITYSVLFSPDKDVISQLRPDLENDRKESDAAVEAALKGMESLGGAGVSGQIAADRELFGKLRQLRNKVDDAAALPLDQRDKALAGAWFASSTELIQDILDTWMTFIKPFVNIDPAATLHMRLKHLLSIILEYTGRERTIVGGLVAGNGEETAEDQAQLVRLRGASDLLWTLGGVVASQGGLDDALGPYLKDAHSQYLNEYNMVKDIFYAPGAAPEPPYPIGIDLWLQLSRDETESLYDLKDSALSETHRHVTDLEQGAKWSILVNLGQAALAFALCGIIFHIVTRRVINPVNYMVEALVNASEGREVSFTLPEESLNDEIGKLARVLRAFQDNVNEIKRASAVLERYTRDLEHTNKELDQFVYVASHDLKAPLRGIDNLASWISEDMADRIDKETLDKLNLLRGRVARLEALLASILSYSRAGRITEKPERLDTGSVVRTVADMNVPPGFTVDIKPLPELEAQRTVLEQIFGNFFTNAVKHHDKGAGVITVSAAPQGKFWEFVVQDDGPGIPVKYHDQIFEMFRTLKSRDVVEGSGLGLSIIKKLVEWQGGRVWVESADGRRGTAFHFLWPKSPPPGG